RDVRVKAASIMAAKKEDEAYKYLENGEQDKAKASNSEAIEMLRSLGYVAGDDLKQQEARYMDAQQQLARPAEEMAPSSPVAKDFLKKQKEIERKNKQAKDAQ